ncbi:MAG: response regulator transcription factor [Halarsenatibacteraceae bacterium]
MQEKILLVEDEEKVKKIAASYLEDAGYQIEIASDGNTALEKVLAEPPDLLILDIMLPGLDGWEIAEEVRNYFDLPILMLTARSDEDDRVKGFEKGADDYLVKPFSPRELVARVKAILKRTNRLRSEVIELPGYDISIKPAAGKVFFVGKDAELTGTEFNIFYEFYKNRGQVLSREQLVNRALGLDYTGFDRTIDVHIKNIRKKLELEKDQLIETVYGMGYRFEIDDSQDD